MALQPDMRERSADHDEAAGRRRRRERRQKAVDDGRRREARAGRDLTPQQAGKDHRDDRMLEHGEGRPTKLRRQAPTRLTWTPIHFHEETGESEQDQRDAR